MILTRQSSHYNCQFLTMLFHLMAAAFLIGNNSEHQGGRAGVVVVEAFSSLSTPSPQLVKKNTPLFWSSTRLLQPFFNKQQQKQQCRHRRQQQEQQQPFPSSSSSLHASNDGGSFTDDEWHPRDPAYTTAQLLARVWFQIAEAGSMVRGESMTVIYPEMEAKLQEPRYLNLFMAHLDHCKDVCDHFGISTALVPYTTSNGKIIGFTAKSFKKSKDDDKDDDDDDDNDNVEKDDNDDEYNFDYDPMWDDGTDFEALYTGIDDEDMAVDPYPAIETPIPDDDDKIIASTKQWVQALCSDMGICPFSPNANVAGLPVGPVFYKVDRHSSVEDVYAAYWEEVVRLEMQPEKDLATILLILPEFQFNNIELFETFSTTLTQPLAALQVEDLLQLVFFHPQWSFRDGGERSGSGQAANYARRSPWPMINLLRTNQVRAAQKGIPTGLVYKQNEKSLNKVGVDKLETMLRLRDWTTITESNSQYKVNRREYDALKIAQDYQQTGIIDKKDLSLAGDATPAANKVNTDAVEQGNLIKILQQALEKRLGKTSPASIKPLTGPETSATALASDFLIKQLDQMAAASGATSLDNDGSTSSPGPTAPSSVAATAATTTSTNMKDTDNVPPPHELLAARQQHLDAARRALLSDVAGGGDDDDGYDSERGNEMSNVMFGRSGVMPRSDDDDDKEAFQKFYG